MEPEAPPLTADVGVADGVIREVGSITSPARRVLDADGALVTPGFVDIHTHYDAQATWADRLIPSSDHGVTTVVMGNCGVGFAPVRPTDHELLIELMEGVEDIPEVVLKEVAFLGVGELRRLHGLPRSAPVRHGRRRAAPRTPAMRVYVMGERRGQPRAGHRGGHRGHARDRRQRDARGCDRLLHVALAPPQVLEGCAHAVPSTPRSTSWWASPLGMKDAGGGVVQAISQFERPRERVRDPPGGGRGLRSADLDVRRGRTE